MSEQPAVHLEAREQQAIQTFIHQLHERFPGQVIQVTLFGSKARGDSGPWSDIDVLLIVREESWALRGEISELGADISLEYGVLIGPRVIGQERWARMERERFGLYRNIAAEGISLASVDAFS